MIMKENPMAIMTRFKALEGFATRIMDSKMLIRAALRALSQCC